MLLTSKTTRNFYDPTVSTDIPDDAVKISIAVHTALFEGQISTGKVIEWGDDGYPFLADPPPTSQVDLEAGERYWRDAQLLSTDPLVSRHRDELEEGSETTLTSVQYSELQAYRRSLRNWPENGEFPLAQHRPGAPPWLPEQIL
ncbi:phage tail assembly chaperone [Pseudomonas mosselii]|uniref:phage tail assembly chaperone n=1 Tax=Pseudomonas mosselii TaxID=78327 RepID=UPI00244CD642|nr:phage tail assembly chaperone [Pseudomonas mosselii]MDH1526712.1 phage tail assembly chaperone [Pseudomonas mosselii]